MSIENKLREWARWANAVDTDIGYKSIWHSIERNAPHSDTTEELTSKPARLALISDEEAALIDKAVANLGKNNVVLANIIKKRYLRNNNCKEIAKYYLTPLQYPHQSGMSDKDKRKKRVNAQTAQKLLEAAHDAVEFELQLIERQKYNQNGGKTMY